MIIIKSRLLQAGQATWRVVSKQLQLEQQDNKFHSKSLGMDII